MRNGDFAMYERENGTKRLLRALENTDNIKNLAYVLRYEPDQLEQDIKALGDYVRNHNESEDKPMQEQEKTYGVYEVYTWDDVSYRLIEKYATKAEAEARATEEKQKNREAFKPSEEMPTSPYSYAVLSNTEYCNLMGK